MSIHGVGLLNSGLSLIFLGLRFIIARLTLIILDMSLDCHCDVIDYSVVYSLRTAYYHSCYTLNTSNLLLYISYQSRPKYCFPNLFYIFRIYQFICLI